MGFLALSLSRAQRADFIAKVIPVTRRIKFYSSFSQRSSALSTQLRSHMVLLSCASASCYLVCQLSVPGSIKSPVCVSCCVAMHS